MFRSKYITYLAARGVNGGASFLLIYVLTRLLDPNEYGVYSLIATTAAIGASVGFQWLINGFSRYVGSTGFGFDQFVGTVLLLGLMSFCVLAVGAIILALNNVFAWDVIKVIYIGIGVGVIGFTNLSLQIQNSSGNEKKYALIALVRAVGNCVGALVLAYLYKTGDLTFLGGTLLAFIAVCAISRLSFNIKCCIDSPNFKEYIKYSAPFIFVSFATVMVDFSDRFIIAHMAGIGAVGGYAVSYDVAQQTIGVLMNISYLVLFPRLIGHFNNGQLRDFKVALSTLQNSLIAIGLISINCFFLLREEVAIILVGPGVRGVVSENMPYVAVAIFLACFKGYFADIPLLLEKKTLKFALIGGAMGLTSIGLNWMLIPIFGVKAAPFCMILSFMLGGAASIFSSRKVEYLKINYWYLLKWVLLTVPVVLLSEFDFIRHANELDDWIFFSIKIACGVGYLFFGCLALNLFSLGKLSYLYELLAGRR